MDSEIDVPKKTKLLANVMIILAILIVGTPLFYVWLLQIQCLCSKKGNV